MLLEPSLTFWDQSPGWGGRGVDRPWDGLCKETNAHGRTSLPCPVAFQVTDPRRAEGLGGRSPV